MMADNELNNVDGGDIFVYTGGEQQVPRDVKRVRIAENIDTILAETFRECHQLIEVEGHNRLRKVEQYAFYRCRRLRRVRNMIGVIEIEDYAFSSCTSLSEHSLGALAFFNLEIIGEGAFMNCNSLRLVNMPSIKRVGRDAFQNCRILHVVFGKDLERIVDNAFLGCRVLRRITIPLKDNLIIESNAFKNCKHLSRVDILAGRIQTTISSLHMKSWRKEMQKEIDFINQTLPSIRVTEKTRIIGEWITSVLQRMEHYKTEHQTLLKEAMTLLELALWKAKLLDETDEKKCKIDDEAARKEHQVTCGASIVIKNVLPFLAMK